MHQERNHFHGFVEWEIGATGNLPKNLYYKFFWSEECEQDDAAWNNTCAKLHRGFTCPFSHLVYRRLCLADNTHVNILIHFPDIVQWIENILAQSDTHRILIHCAVGSSRSGAIAMAYVLFKEHRRCTLQQVSDRLVTIRPIIQPNLGFYEQLQQYERQLQQQIINN